MELRHVAAMLAGTLICGCSSAPEAPPPPHASSSGRESTSPEVAPRSPGSGGIDPALRRLAQRVISYALGRTDTLPTAASVSFGLDGEPIKVVDDMPDALSDRRIWRVCPGDVDAYAGFSCPLDLLEPITNAEEQGSRLVLTRDAEVLCARSALDAPRGRFVVIRPRGAMVSCLNDFALVLTADTRGRLTSAIMTISEP